MNKLKILLYLMIILSIILCIPSIIYLINNKTVDGFDSYYTYTLKPWTDEATGLMNGIIVIGLLLIINIIYILVIKKQNKIFKDKKQAFIFIIVISFIFTLILPYLSSDIYYYIGDSWLASKYGQNPYYTSVFDLQVMGINDEILNNTGYWKHTTSIYGPIWNYIATALVGFSFGNITIALFIFKLVSLLIHIANCYVIFKLTKSTKYLLLYGINPLVLMDFLSNVHNDIYLILFVLLALYFMIRKKDIILTIVFLAISIGIKYSTVLLVPFLLLYYFRDKSYFKRILYCLISGISIIGIVALFYIPYYKDFTVFTNMLVQGEKYNQSIWLYLILKLERDLFYGIKRLFIPIFVTIYVLTLCFMVFKKKILFKELMKKYNLLMLIFIFLVLATFQKWYILWLLPTIIWQSKNMKKFLIYLMTLGIIPTIDYFISGNDLYIYGMTHSIKILCIAICAWAIDYIITYYVKEIRKKKKEIICQD